MDHPLRGQRPRGPPPPCPSGVHQIPDSYRLRGMGRGMHSMQLRPPPFQQDVVLQGPPPQLGRGIRSRPPPPQPVQGSFHRLPPPQLVSGGHVPFIRAPPPPLIPGGQVPFRQPPPVTRPQRPAAPRASGAPRRPPPPPNGSLHQLQPPNEIQPLAQPEAPYIRSTAELQLYSDLSAATKIRADRKRLQLVQLLDDFKAKNPETNLYRALLAMVTSEASFRKAHRDSFVFAILEAFESWLQRQNVRESIQDQLTMDIQKLAFEKFKIVNWIGVFNLAVKVYQLNKISDTFKPEVQQMLSNRKDFLRGCEVIMCLGNHDSFSLEEITIPLTISTSTSMMTEQFLDGSKQHQIRMLQWLDSLTEMSPNVIEIGLLRNYPQIEDLNVTRLSGIPLGKFIKKIISKYDLDPNLASRHMRTKTVGAFRYLIKEKTSPTMRKANWRDLVMQQAKDDPELQRLLLKFLTEGRVTETDIPEAAYWAGKFKIPVAELPYVVAEELKRIESGIEDLTLNTKQNEEEEFWDDDSPAPRPQRSPQVGNVSAGASSRTDDWGPEVLTFVPHESPEFLSLDIASIIFVDDKSKFDNFMIQIKNQYQIGLDVEFLSKPFGAKETASILQLGTSENNYILDIVALIKIISDEQMDAFVRHVFIEGAHVILGYGLNTDLQVLGNTHKAFEKIPDRSINLLDLDWLTKLSTSGSDKLFDLPRQTQRKGLSGLAEMVVGKPLDKRDQISDWMRRPLTKEQLVYAALDAKVLVLIYDGLLTLAENAGKHDALAKIEHQLKRNRNKPPSQSKKHKQPKKDLQKEEATAKVIKQAPWPNSNQILPEDLRVVCDSMLQGLSKRLGYEGVDSVAIEPFESVENCGEKARAENRMILTRGLKRYALLAKFVSSGSCLAIKSDQMDEQMKEVWAHFKVKFGNDFEKCEACHGSRHVTLPSDIVYQISININKTAPPSSVRPYQHDDYNEFDDSDDDDDDDIPYVPAAKPEVIWHKSGETEIDLSSGKTRDGIELKIGEITKTTLLNNEKFYGCLSCGQMSLA